MRSYVWRNLDSLYEPRAHHKPRISPFLSGEGREDTRRCEHPIQP